MTTGSRQRAQAVLERARMCATEAGYPADGFYINSAGRVMFSSLLIPARVAHKVRQVMGSTSQCFRCFEHCAFLRARTGQGPTADDLKCEVPTADDCGKTR